MDQGWARSSDCSGGNCVEVKWVKSSTCGAGTCVEVSRFRDTVLVRDSKVPSRAPLVFTTEEWAAFVAGVKRGEFG